MTVAEHRPETPRSRVWFDWFCDWFVSLIVVWLFAVAMVALGVAWLAGKL